MDLAARLEARRGEIERAVLVRVHAVSDPCKVEDLEYVVGLREAVGTGLAHGIAAIDDTRPSSVPVPAQLLAQARAAARNGVTLEIVLRRYVAGYSLLVESVLEEAPRTGAIPAPALRQALRNEAQLFDRLVSSVSNAYAGEALKRSGDTRRDRAERVEMLLAGKLIDEADLGYDLSAWHIGAIASGPDAQTAIRDLAVALDRRQLTIVAGEGSLWVWLGGRRKISTGEAMRLAQACWPPNARLALGEECYGLDGWRSTHRQAKAANTIALRGRERLVRYADVALLSAAMRDEVLASSLRDVYLAPLEDERDGGTILRDTLAAYFLVGRNASAAAAALGVSRNTVSTRLRSVEELIGRPVDGCAAELATALRLRKLTARR